MIVTPAQFWEHADDETVVDFCYGVSIIRIPYRRGTSAGFLASREMKKVEKQASLLKKGIIPLSTYTGFWD
jgi:hypothetical protein